MAIHPAVSLSLTSKTNAHVIGVMPSSACLTVGARATYDSRRLCHYRFCPKEQQNQNQQKLKAPRSHFKA